MKTIVAALTVLVALGAAVPAFADTNVCTVEAAKAQPKEALKSKLEADGWTVRQIKDNRGCYEAYAVKAGARMENLFDPATLEMLDVEAD